MTDTKREAPASLEKRAAALEIVLRRKADMPKTLLLVDGQELSDHGHRYPADQGWQDRSDLPPRELAQFSGTASCKVRSLRRASVLVGQAFIPPSTVRFAPVMYEDSGPATNATNAATSSTCP